MMLNDLPYNKVEEFLGKICIQPGFFGEPPQATNLRCLPVRIGSGQLVLRLQYADLPCRAKTLCQNANKSSVQIINSLPVCRKLHFDLRIIHLGTFKFE